MILNRTRITLTLQYSVLLLVVFWIFSLGIYLYMDHTFGGDRVNITGDQQDSSELSQRKIGASEATDSGLDNLRMSLLIINGVLLVVVPAVSFALANSSLKPVEESFESQQRFVDDAAHELRTPIAISQAELELALQQPRTKNEYKKTIQITLQETKQLGDLVSNLLFLSRGQMQDIEKSFQTVNFNELVTKAIKNVKINNTKKTLTIATQLGAKKLVRVNESLVNIAITNVLENAVKYSKPNGEIQVITKTKKNVMELIIKDSGIGMDQQELIKAFDRFWRAEATRHAKGHGLGLPLAKQIIQLHGGSIKMHSTPHEGTTVFISLPFSQASLN